MATMIALASAAFGVIAALAWNTAISDLIKTYLPAGKGIVSEFIYAVIVTIVAIVVLNSLGRLAQSSGGESKIK
ncbi:MAG: hypothetical protein JO219_05625 [Candidatus Eremiobacteraeota bacterium]|nr:hypothetical protein [Candidatus Eremiobacteraeota bacterium]MBV8366206.1 hypothetical protein [Candidatus Eremiobacteraeota bacterium]